MSVTHNEAGWFVTVDGEQVMVRTERPMWLWADPRDKGESTIRCAVMPPRTRKDITVEDAIELQNLAGMRCIAFIQTDTYEGQVDVTLGEITKTATFI